MLAPKGARLGRAARRPVFCPSSYFVGQSAVCQSSVLVLRLTYPITNESVRSDVTKVLRTIAPNDRAN